jgi:hypothetical protein
LQLVNPNPAKSKGYLNKARDLICQETINFLLKTSTIKQKQLNNKAN